MRIQDVKIGEYYRLASTKGTGEFNGGYYGWVKILEIYKKGQYNNPHPNKLSCVKCEHVIEKDSKMGFIRYFRPSEIVKDN